MTSSSSARALDAHDRGAPLAGGATLAVPAGGVRVLHPGVDDENHEARLVEAERHDLRLERATVEENRVVAHAEQRRRLVHDAGRGSDGDVLGALADPGKGWAVETQLPDVIQGERHRAFDRGRRREAGAHGHVRIDEHVEARHRGQVRPELVEAEGPGNAQNVG